MTQQAPISSAKSPCVRDTLVDSVAAWQGATMTKPALATAAELSAWHAQHPAWNVQAREITRRYEFPNFSAAVGLAAEKHDHHPDIELKWGKVSLLWTTHDADGITALDLKLAEISDKLCV
jgi:4a-hydroxytetrahydrobiopterin dehydratase